MRYRVVLIVSSTILAIFIASIHTFSRNAGLITNTPESYSIFNMPQNLGPNVNGANINNELATIAPSGLSLYFMSTRPGGLGGNDIYVSQRATLSSAWGPAVNVGVLNTGSNEAPGSISPDGLEMFLTSTRTGSLGGPDLWLSTRKDPNNDFGWTTPVHLGAVINSTFGEQTPTYFVDPSSAMATLFFSSDRISGTTNVKDIYQSTRNADGTFDPPTLVSELNSTADDNRPAISRDGLEIFFGSNRTGGRAILISTRASTNAAWNPPISVGSLNEGGVAAQPSLSADGTILYFTSNRPGGLGTGDLYSSVRVSVNRNQTADFDGDGRTDFSVFRPSDGTWHLIQSSTNTYVVQRFGSSGDKIVPGDFDGDGRTDHAIWRPVTGVWWILRSSDGIVSTTTWGVSTDKPVPGDYDGDGQTDIAVYRDGTWFILQSSDGMGSYGQFGLSTDVPVAMP